MGFQGGKADPVEHARQPRADETGNVGRKESLVVLIISFYFFLNDFLLFNFPFPNFLFDFLFLFLPANSGKINLAAGHTALCLDPLLPMFANPGSKNTI